VVSLMDSENTPVRPADQASRLLDWGFAVPAGIHGVGTLVDSGALPPLPPSTTAPRPTVEAVPTAHAISSTVGHAGGTSPPWLLLALAAGAVAVVAATVMARRHAVRAAPRVRPPPGPPPGEDSPPRSAGGSPSRLP
jgi:D-alanyl-D-alanine carboxypeptidase (penicillin-binding protein 5/6)